ncbi:diacylglycerol kinase [Carnimonas bestiolae]|uniref:diacylglycerol kinase n=1 Tax=Carnimonas bestiolae TaxID=3402172 RepID=UPI003EDC0CDD
MYSCYGLRDGWRFEEAFRLEVVLFVPLFIASFWLAHGVVEWLILVISVLQLMLCELFNSAIEAVVDRIGSEHHELSGRAKDLAAGAVMISIAITLLVWGGFIVARLIA